MNILNWVIYLIFGFLAFTPLTMINLFNVDEKYKNFKYVSISLLLWWITDFLRLVIRNYEFQYYLSLTVFPVVFLFTIVFLISIFDYFKTSLPKSIKIVLYLFLIIDILVTYTNKYHNMLVELDYSSNITLEIFRNAPLGLFFYIHTFIAYTSLLIGIGMVLGQLFKKYNTTGDKVPFVLLLLSISFGILLNITHITLRIFTLDPSLITTITTISILYYVFYMRDLKLILGLNRNNFILNNLREKYVITDETNHIVDASKSFKELFDIDVRMNIPFEEFQNSIKDDVYFYTEDNKLKIEMKPGMIYLNTLKKDINLPFYKYSGSFYLFYDETNNLKYMHDAKYIKTHDLMTSIYNRNYLEELRDKLDDSNDTYDIILFDLDGLKIINDTLGHNEGDKLLQRFSRQLLEVTKDKNVYPIRLGGDEFIILSINNPNVFIKEILNDLNEINSKLPFIKSVHYSFSHIRRKDETETLRDLLTKADIGLYDMKASKHDYKDQLIEKIKKENSKH